MPWTDPSDAGTLDLATGQIVTETNWDAMRRDLERLGGTDGNSKTGPLRTIVHNLGSALTGAVAVDLSQSNVFRGTLTGNITITFSNPLDGAKYTLMLLQDATGSRSVTFPAEVEFPHESQPAASGANKMDVYVLQYDGARTKYYAQMAANLS